MNFIKSLVADSLNGIVLSEMPFIVFRIFIAGLIGFVLAKQLKKSDEAKNSWLHPALGMLAAVVALGVEHSLPMSILALASVILLYPKKEVSWMFQLILALCVALGILCGMGNVFLAILGLLVSLPIFIFRKK